MSKHFLAKNTKVLLKYICALSCILSSVSVSGQSFGLSKLDLKGSALQSPSNMAFGPDGRLYVAEEEGQIHVFEIERSGANDYKVVTASQIRLIQSIPNHHEDGSPAPEIANRTLTALIVAGSASHPILYVSSFDPREGVSGNGDMNLDTNSGIISKISRKGSSWEMVHLVRGLPRGKECQGSNGLFLSADGHTLYIAQAGHTNAGAPSEAFALSTEYALSAGILSVDLALIESLPSKTDAEGQTYKYDLPTVKHKNQMGGGDISSSKLPWGGLDGLNQARLVLGGPVQVYAPGFRNPKDILISRAGFMYVTEEGAKANLGNIPKGAGSPQFDGNKYISGINNFYTKEAPAASTARISTQANLDAGHSLHLVQAGYFGGHPNPIRANPRGAGIFVEGSFRTEASGNLPQAWPPVDLALANPEEANLRSAEAEGQGVLFQEEEGLRSLAEYTASNFSSAMQGDILISTYCKTGKIHKISPSAQDGSGYPPSTLIAGLGEGVVAIETLGDETNFPGTIWALIHKENKINILEPSDYGIQMEEEELDTDGNSHLRLPAGSNVDFDQDGIPNELDAFAWDKFNGSQKGISQLPFHVSFKKKTDLKEESQQIHGTFPINSEKHDLTRLKSVKHSLIGRQAEASRRFQTGVKLCEAEENVWVRSQLKGPYFSGGSSKEYLQGMYIGSGDEDNFLMLGLRGDGNGGGGILIVEETEGESIESFFPVEMILSEAKINLFWEIDPFQATAQAYFSRTHAEDLEPIGPTVRLSGKSRAALNCEYDIQGVSSHFALGLHASSGSEAEFVASYDFLEVYTDRQSCGLELGKAKVDFLAIPENTRKQVSLDLNNPLMFKFDISHIQLSGRDADDFSIQEHTFTDLDAEHPAKLEIEFHPKSSGHKEALLQIFTTCSSKALEIPLKGLGATFSEILYRVNAGGSEIPATDGGLDWQADEERQALSYTQHSQPVIELGTTAGNLSYHSSVPGITPPELFERARKAQAGELMTWSFPVSGKAGDIYQVCLYMVNSAHKSSSAGKQLFDLQIEGKTVARNLDLSEEFGHQTAATLCFPIQLESDASIDIDFLPLMGSPIVNALEIRGKELKSEQAFYEIKYFDAQLNNSEALLQWGTNGSNPQGFFIQMMQERDGSAALFQDIGFVPGKGPNSSYVFQVPELVPDNYVFRLKQLDQEGNHSYSEHKKLEVLSEEMGLYTYPNPSKGMLNVTLTSRSEQDISLNLLDVSGKKIKLLFRDKISAGSHKLGFNIGRYPNGIYLLEASNGQIRKVSKVVLSK